MYMKSNAGEIEVFLCPEYNPNTTATQPQSQLRPYTSQVSVAANTTQVFMRFILNNICFYCRMSTIR